jgi:hypothetical protein
MFGSEPHITTLCLSRVVQFSRRRGGLSPPRALGTSRLVGLAKHDFAVVFEVLVRMSGVKN